MLNILNNIIIILAGIIVYFMIEAGIKRGSNIILSDEKVCDNNNFDYNKSSNKCIIRK